MAKKEVELDVRGATLVVVAGNTMSLEPTFRNLAAMERALGRGLVGFLAKAQGGDIAVSDIAVIISTCAIPAQGSKYPEGWGRDFVGQAMMDDGFDTYVTAVIEMLGKALSAKPKKSLTKGSAASGEA